MQKSVTYRRHHLKLIVCLVLLHLSCIGPPVADTWIASSGNVYVVRHISEVQHDKYGRVLHIQYKSPSSHASEPTNEELREVLTIIVQKFDLENYDTVIVDALFENLLFINCGRIDLSRHIGTIKEIKDFLEEDEDFPENIDQ